MRKIGRRMQYKTYSNYGLVSQFISLFSNRLVTKSEFVSIKGWTYGALISRRNAGWRGVASMSNRHKPQLYRSHERMLCLEAYRLNVQFRRKSVRLMPLKMYVPGAEFHLKGFALKDLAAHIKPKM